MDLHKNGKIPPVVKECVDKLKEPEQTILKDLKLDV